MFFDRFDIVEAYYLAYAHCHRGQYSPEYARLSKISTYFRPAMGLDVESLTENGLAIYEAVCNRLLGGK